MNYDLSLARYYLYLGLTMGCALGVVIGYCLR